MKKRGPLISLILIFVLVIIIKTFADDAIKIVLKDVIRNNDIVTNTISHSRRDSISYSDSLKLSKIFPKSKYKGRIYYSVYGKKILEDQITVDFSDVKIDDNFKENLKLLPNVKNVKLYNQDLTSYEKLDLKNAFENIKFEWDVDIAGENVEYDIEELDLTRKKINNLNDFKASLKLLSNLKKLDMSYTNLSNSQLGALREEFPNIKIDWVVYLGKWSLKTDSVAFSVLIYKYDYKRMTSNDIQVLKYCTELQALDLGHQSIQDISVIGNYLPNLRVLILADNIIKDISPLAKLKHLHYLELFMNDITDCSPLAQCKELVDLNISFNYRFSNINGILNLPLLERLWLISDNISSASYAKIRKTYPNVKLITTGEGSTESGWRTHPRYHAMIDMFRNRYYISEEFTKYDNK